jgi:hypothetical protein
LFCITWQLTCPKIQHYEYYASEFILKAILILISDLTSFFSLEEVICTINKCCTCSQVLLFSNISIE